MSRASLVLSSLMAAASAQQLYCPGEDDFNAGGQWNGNGWTITGPGGVNGNTTFNLLGGYIEFDMDTSGAQTGVNTNFYLVFPDPSYFGPYNDCDIQGVGKPTCMEMDIVEMNGNCVGQTTWHTWPNHDGGCDQSGCSTKYQRSGTSHFRAEFAENGWMTVFVDGQQVNGYNPTPSQSSVNYAQQTMSSVGAQIMSSQWQGWVPSGNCGAGGSLEASTYSINNIVISGSVVQGNPPQLCSGQEEETVIAV